MHSNEIRGMIYSNDFTLGTKIFPKAHNYGDHRPYCSCSSVYKDKSLLKYLCLYSQNYFTLIFTQRALIFLVGSSVFNTETHSWARYHYLYVKSQLHMIHLYQPFISKTQGKLWMDRENSTQNL